MAELTFESVDDLSFAAQQGRAQLQQHLARLELAQLGPVVEYAWLRRKLVQLPSLTCAQQTELSDRFRAFATSPGFGLSTSMNDGSPHDFTLIGVANGGPNELAWQTFLSRMKQAAMFLGIGKERAGGLVGALLEMSSNAVEHSQRSTTAIAAFSTGKSAFEFVVADAGVGALASLRLSEEYKGLHDTGSALKLCVSDGVSRHGSGQGRGLGFHVLFARLADHNARIRIRSDDQLIDLRGDQMGPRVAVPATRPLVGGFLVTIRIEKP